MSDPKYGTLNLHTQVIVFFFYFFPRDMSVCGKEIKIKLHKIHHLYARVLQTSMDIPNENCCYKNISMSLFPGTLWQKGAVLWELNSSKNVGERWVAEVKNKKGKNMVLEFFPFYQFIILCNRLRNRICKTYMESFLLLIFLISEVQR